MPKTVIKKEMHSFIYKNHLKMPCSQIDDYFGISKGCTIRFLKKNGISIPKEITNKLRAQKQIGKTSFSQKEDEIIKENYLKITLSALAKLLGKSTTGIKGRMKVMNLVIPQELADYRKEIGMYRKGAIPPNKGKRQSEYMSAEAIEKTKATRFKKNNIPHNAKKEWEEVVRKEKNGYKYLMIKLPRSRSLVYKHIWMWEQKNGKTPKGYNIVFKSKNTLEFTLEDLECISNAELMKRNSVHRFPEELRNLILLKGALKRQINKLEKH